MASWFEIDEYKAAVLAGEDGPAARVTLLSDGKIVGTCSFYPEDVSLPANEVRTTIELSYPFAAYTAVLDLLRNESPVCLWFDAEAATGMVTTLPEPVGEGEG